MDLLNEVLPILLYIFSIILIIILIILGIKSIRILDKVDRIADDMDQKLQSLNGIFTIIDRSTDAIALATDRFINTIATAIGKIFRKNKKEMEDDE